jgi:2-polyprenyl-6-hydroxyphenyl methylase / 3-demethylubiquinone-9 3-methyltransferase
MTKASTPPTRNATINPSEAAHFGKLAAEWWDPKGSSAMLHRLNPARLGFVRSAVDAHFGGDPAGVRPLIGLTALDVGCGAGLLCEPLARLGAQVTGVDAAPENIEVAKAHAGQSGLNVFYWAGELAFLPAMGRGSSEAGGEARAEAPNCEGQTISAAPLHHPLDGPPPRAGEEHKFDLVTSMEVIEHVVDPAVFVGELAAQLKPDGLMILSTPNRTMASKLLLVEAAEWIGQVPKGTHDWNRFLTPEELTVLLTGAGMEVVTIQGIFFSPMKGLHLSENKMLNYILAARFKA